MILVGCAFVRGWDMGSKESTEEEVGNEDIEMDVWCYKDGQDKEWKN